MGSKSLVAVCGQNHSHKFNGDISQYFSSKLVRPLAASFGGKKTKTLKLTNFISSVHVDYPDPAKLLLFVISSWSDLLSLHGVVSKAIQAVLKILAKDDVGSCLGAYLSWGKVSGNRCIFKSQKMLENDSSQTYSMS